MDIPSMSTAVSQTETKQKVAIANMDKAMNQMETQGNGLINMLNQSSGSKVESEHPSLGIVIDIKA